MGDGHALFVTSWQTGLRALLVFDRAVPAFEAALADAVCAVDGARAADSLDRMTRLVRAAEAAMRLLAVAPPGAVHGAIARDLTALVTRLGTLGAVWVPGPLVPLRDRLRRAVAELAMSHARVAERLWPPAPITATLPSLRLAG